MILEEFIEWEIKHRSEFLTMAKLLREKLSDDPEELMQDLTTIEAWNSRAGSLLAECNSWLDKASMVLKPSRESGTELDRKVTLEGTVAPIRMVRDKLENVCSCIKQRLILGESMLRYHIQFIQKNGNQVEE